MKPSVDEERKMLNLSVIPAAILTYVLVAWFIYVIHGQRELSLTQYLLYFGLPFVIAMPAVFFLSYEILSNRLVKKPLRCHIKRFLGRMSIILAGAGSFTVLLTTTHLALTLQTGEWNVFLVAGIIWFVVWVLLVSRFKETFKTLSDGVW